MPKETNFVLPEVFAIVHGVTIYRTYINDQIDQGVNHYRFTTDPHSSDFERIDFDIRMICDKSETEKVQKNYMDLDLYVRVIANALELGKIETPAKDDVKVSVLTQDDVAENEMEWISRKLKHLLSVFDRLNPLIEEARKHEQHHPERVLSQQLIKELHQITIFAHRSINVKPDVVRMVKPTMSTPKLIIPELEVADSSQQDACLEGKVLSKFNLTDLPEIGSVWTNGKEEDPSFYQVLAIANVGSTKAGWDGIKVVYRNTHTDRVWTRDADKWLGKKYRPVSGTD